MAVYFLDSITEKKFSDPNKRFFRIISCDRAIEMLDKNQWVFVSPELWNDPYERAFLEATYNIGDQTFNLPIMPNKDGRILYAQCFSETSESEGFWNTYSPTKDGISFSITAQSLLEVLNNVKSYDVYIGAARYETHQEMYDIKRNVQFWFDIMDAKNTKEHLKLMLKKRKQFEFEKEIRILLLRKKRMNTKISRIKVENCNLLYDKIRFDPRMGKNFAEMLKREFKDHYNVNAELVHSGLYKKPGRHIRFGEELTNNEI
jgi:hypothetical protein